MERDAHYWVERLGLEEHPEGGFYRRTYQADEAIPGECLPERFGGARLLSTAIYYLLPGGGFSAFHRIKSDEMWHFYAGVPLDLHMLDDGGVHSTVRLGRDFDRGEVFQAVVKAGVWFGAVVCDPESYSLVGCTVAPGFAFEDFELACREDLLARFPEHREIVERLTRP
ncbi:MAG: cupin domain-containing protein [Desulfobacteraceae bacterium]|nr:cupin domain-containing protein [Desulfobacteraceae bacterium]